MAGDNKTEAPAATPAHSAAKLHFAVLAIGATAKKIGVPPPAEIYRRLKRHDLVRRLLFDCYDTLHSESLQNVALCVELALKNRER